MECRRGTTLERFPLDLPSVLQRPEYSRTNTASTWEWIVRVYSSTSLTYLTDRLVALSGIARQMQAKTGYHYMAGMWRESLGTQLCWAATNGTRADEDAAYVAPTWSWASTAGPVEFDGWIDGEEARKPDYWMSVVDVDIKLKGSDPFGQLISATLRLECSSLLHATVSIHAQTSFWSHLAVAQHRLYYDTSMT